MHALPFCGICCIGVVVELAELLRSSLVLDADELDMSLIRRDDYHLALDFSDAAPRVNGRKNG